MRTRSSAPYSPSSARWISIATTTASEGCTNALTVESPSPCSWGRNPPERSTVSLISS